MKDSIRSTKGSEIEERKAPRAIVLKALGERTCEEGAGVTAAQLLEIDDSWKVIRDFLVGWARPRIGRPIRRAVADEDIAQDTCLKLYLMYEAGDFATVTLEDLDRLILHVFKCSLGTTARRECALKRGGDHTVESLSFDLGDPITLPVTLSVEVDDYRQRINAIASNRLFSEGA